VEQLKEFNFEALKIRSIIDENGEPWFVATDVMKALDIKAQAHALRKLEDCDRGEVSLQGSEGFRKNATVNESGLYSLILESKKPAAKKFKKWVTAEVLPAIRKKGSYLAPTLASVVEMGPLERLEGSSSKLHEAAASPDHRTAPSYRPSAARNQHRFYSTSGSRPRGEARQRYLNP